MSLIQFAAPVKVDPQYICGGSIVYGFHPAKVLLERPNAHLEKHYQDLVTQHNALLQATLCKGHTLPTSTGRAPPGLEVGPHEIRACCSRKRSDSLSSCGASTKASTRERSHSVCSFSDDDERSESSSIILRNIPTAFTRAALVELLDKHGLKGEYNMVCLPIDRFRKKARGFAFVNFESHEGAKRCMSTFQGFQKWGTPSAKVCTVEWSKKKGDLQSKVLAYGSGAIVRSDVPDEFKPALFRGGVQVPYSADMF
jgi:hypothetical protein